MTYEALLSRPVQARGKTQGPAPQHARVDWGLGTKFALLPMRNHLRLMQQLHHLSVAALLSQHERCGARLPPGPC